MDREMLKQSIERYGRARAQIQDALERCEEDLQRYASDPDGPLADDLAFSAQLTDVLTAIDERIAAKEGLLRALP